MKNQRLQHNYSSQQCCLLYVSHWQKASWLIQQIICVTATVAGHPFWSLGTSADRFLGFCSLLLFSHWPVWWGRWSGTWWCLSPCQTSEEQDRSWVAVWSVYRPGCSSWVDDPYVIRGLLHPQGVFAGVLDKTNLNVVNLLLVVHHQDQRFAVVVDGAVPYQEGPVLSWPVHEGCISHAGVISLTVKESLFYLVDQVQGVLCVRAVTAPDVPLFLTVPLRVSECVRAQSNRHCKALFLAARASRASSLPGLELVLEYGHADFLKLEAKARLVLFVEINECVFSPCSKFSCLQLNSQILKWPTQPQGPWQFDLYLLYLARWVTTWIEHGSLV